MTDKVQSRATDYQLHLDRVSRSFAFCIAQLEGDLRFYVGHCYLLFRVLDTIEDAPWSSIHDQSRSFKDFNSFLENRPDTKLWSDWKATLLQMDLPSGERDLIEDSAQLFADFHELLSDGVRPIVFRCALNMSHGMEYFCRRGHGKKLELNNLLEVNRYCFFVAGVVGELLHHLFLKVYPAGDQKGHDTDKHLSNALHFGLFLQKVNILKDQRGDEEEGRYLVPSRAEVQNSLLVNAKRALEYLMKLPVDAVSYRLFCAWSLFLGMASLPFIEKSWTTHSGVKIPRVRTKILLDRVAVRIQQNDQLQKIFEELMSKLQWPKASAVFSTQDSADFPEFKGLYAGELSEVQLRSLGLIR